MFKLDLEKAEERRVQIANICWIIKKAHEFQRKHLLLLNDYPKAFDCVDHNKVWKILQEMGIPDHLTCLLRNLYAGKKQQLELEWNNRLVVNWERIMSSLYIVILFI